jgi:hypothetical protein
MDWFLLLILLPLILVPVVFLCGFAGCELPVTGTGSARPPTNLRAVPMGTFGVDLTWDEGSGTAAGTYTVSRDSVPIATDVTGTSFNDRNLVDGTTYFYQVSSKWNSDESTDQVPATTGLTTPTGLTAVPVPPTPGSTDSAIKLDWINNSVTADRIVLNYRPSGNPVFLPIPPLTPIIPPLPTGTLTHHGLNPGIFYEYQILAAADGFDENHDPLEIFSKPSSSVVAPAPALIPLVWKIAFQGVLNANLPGEQNKCVVQRLKAPLAFGGSQVKITLRGSLAGPIAIDRMTISQVAGAGDPYDSAADLVEVFGPPGVTLVANVPQTFGPTNYTLDPAKDLIVAFDIGATGAGRKGPLVGSAYFSHNAIDEAAKQDRSPAGYVKTADSLFLIEKIEVLTVGP